MAHYMDGRPTKELEWRKEERYHDSVGSSLSPSLFHLLYITQYNPHLFISLAMTSLDEYLRIWDDMVSIHIPPPVYLLQYFLSYTNSGPWNVSGDQVAQAQRTVECAVCSEIMYTIFVSVVAIPSVTGAFVAGLPTRWTVLRVDKTWNIHQS